MSERINTIVIGGGQAGLAVGYYLAKRAIPFVILEANRHIGDSWRNRWDTLRLFTLACYSGLDGMPFPAPARSFPTKDEMADYLEAYATYFDLPVRTGVCVDNIRRGDGGYILSAGESRYEAKQIVVATGSRQRPWIPPFASGLDPDIVQLHSSAYRNPKQLRQGSVLVVGRGNSGSEIARELASHGHPVALSGRSTGHAPFSIDSFLGRHLLCPLVEFVFYRVLTTDTKIGRRVRPYVISRGRPVIRVKLKDLAAVGVERVPRTAKISDGLPVLEDGRVLSPANVVWCTGFRPDLAWIDLPIIANEFEPIHERGVVKDSPGLYFVGLEFLYSVASGTVPGISRDARYTADKVAARVGSGQSDA
jgi:putative flavoprotein involved in K+ transport